MSIVAIDTETTGIGPDRRIWELGLIVTGELPGWAGNSQALRRGATGELLGHYRWFVDAADLDLGNADPFALRVGRFYDRHPQMVGLPAVQVLTEAELLRLVEMLTRGAHLLGAVPNFDADVLDRRMRAHGILPSWHYHLCDIEAMAIGYLHGTGYAREFPDRMVLPWKSDDLSRACGVEPPSGEERHTALGDARWALQLYHAITGGSGG